ncbi:ribosomal protein L14-domain-containing protein [Trametes elegans]|nr:ribosomal protein L14-domain-containing protein [Trametes elegans]
MLEGMHHVAAVYARPQALTTGARVAHVINPLLQPAQVFDDDNDILKHDNMPAELDSIFLGQNAQPSNFKRFVEVGRVVLLKSGPQEGHIAVIAEIIDHNRAIIDGPTTGVPRQAFPYRHLTLTPLVVSSLPRAAGTGVVRKYVEKEGIVEKWNKSSWAQKREAVAKRRSLNDFERFVVMLAKKQRRDRVRKTLKKASA